MKYTTHIKNLKRSISCRLPIILLLAILTQSGCEKFVQVDMPSTQLTSVTVFESNSTATAALMDVYIKLRESSLFNGNSFGTSRLIGFYADELSVIGESNTSGQRFADNVLIGTDDAVARWWTSSYQIIFGVNAIIEGLEASTLISDADKAQVTGEALFIRAFVHFYLVNLYGKVPYITTTDYVTNTAASRMDIQEVYSKIIDDLEKSESLLPVAYPATERIRVNKSAVRAVLARVFLYRQSWERAIEKATAVIDDPGYFCEDSLNDVFLKSSRSAIWQFKPAIEGINSQEAQVFLSGPLSTSFTVLSQLLLDDFEPGDKRKELWTSEKSINAINFRQAFKYKKWRETTSTEYSVILRIEEQYLIRAECRAHLGDEEGSREDLNRIRLRAGLANNTTDSGNELLEAIIRERRIELFAEFGHRFFDLKRTRRLDTELSVKTGWNSNDSILPLPQAELLINTHLGQQNPGY